MHRPRRRRRPIYRRVRRAIKRGLTRAAGVLVPRLYAAYLALVWRTSRVVDHGLAEGQARLAPGRGFVALLWHEEVVLAPYVYRALGFRAHVLIGRGGPGDLAAAVAEHMGHPVTRGGTSRRSSRHRPIALRSLIRQVQADPGSLLAVLVDGPSGPRYRIKPGAVLAARACGLPLVLLRVWCRRGVRLDTWDRALFPLPWNEIHVYGVGPIEVPEDSPGRAGLERLRQHLEHELTLLAGRSLHDTGHTPPEILSRRLSARPPAASSGSADAAEAPSQA